MNPLLIIGAKSDMAQAIARKFAENNHDIYLALRNPQRLDDFEKDLQVRYNVQVKKIDLDVCQYGDHAEFFESLDPKPTGVVCAVGYLGDQEKAQNDFSETQRIIESNYVGCVSLLNIIANNFEKEKNGFIIGISSVAGDRGRKSNYIYGSAKAGFTAYLSGLRNRLFASGIKVLTVKPGFVYTKMTQNLDLPEKLTAKPEDVAEAVYNAHQKGKDTIYCKALWRYIMLIIRLIPEFQFKKMSI